MNSYRTSTWGDEISLEYGKSLKGYQNSNGKYQVFGSNGPIGWTDKPLCKGPGIILGRKGAYRGVKFSEKDFYVIDTAYYVVPKTDIDLNWLYYAIKYHKLGEIDDGSPIPSTTRAAVYVREFDIPSKEVQVKMGNILKKIDLKIELNNQINETLESIAQAIFKSWFIDFEPVRVKIAAKQEGNDPELAAMCVISGKSEEELQQMAKDDFAELQATAALFPDEFVDSELVEMPKGWEVGCVEDIATAKGGYAFKGSQFVEKGYPVIKIKNITGDGEVDIQGTQCIEEKTARTAAKFMLHDCDLVMAMTGATVGKIGLVNTHGKSIYLNQRVAKFESEKFGGKISYFLFCLFNRKEYFEQIVGTAQGSAQPNISSSGIESTSIIVPNFELINLFIKNTDSIFQYWLKNGSTNNFLNQIRDTLLPKLLSGEVEIPDFINEGE